MINGYVDDSKFEGFNFANEGGVIKALKRLVTGLQVQYNCHDEVLKETCKSMKGMWQLVCWYHTTTLSVSVYNILCNKCDNICVVVNKMDKNQWQIQDKI